MQKIVLFSIALLITWSCKAQTDKEKVNETISKNDIEGHIYFLASDELKGRETGTPEIDIAASYLANSFRRYGVKPANNGSYYQTVELQKTTAAKELSVKLNDMSSPNILPLQGGNIDYSGTAAYLNYGTEEDFKNKDVKGKIVVVKAGTKENEDARSAFRSGRAKTKLAEENGAIGLIELSTLDNQMWDRLSHNFGSDKLGLAGSNDEKELLHIWLQDIDGSIEKAISSTKNIPIELNISGVEKKTVPSKNVVGMVEGTDPKLKDEFIIYSAHYDHIGIGETNAENDSIYNGARDNAVGTVTVLSAAENIAKYPTKRSALFILFTGEEKGLLGSKWYVEHPVIPLEQMVYCFNSDNGGYNDTSIATIIGLNRTTAGDHIKNAATEFGLKAIDDPAGEQGLFDRSDNVNFAAKGIPAPTYSLGFTAFDAEIGKYYHQTADNPDNLDYDYLEKFFKSYVMACRLIANDSKTPFWIEGDKYYNAGKSLYNMK
ncbi:M28 family peptidase [Aureibaculum sp. 2210JD6-5]|uniref:M28 family peptidase n=1 Tax=Aureibaculum sp. 2210JD6-5 TaxID=3103957 RepID=UPI002AAD7166|nr:M28 family peptidase [Aureibaculum sp. 2210JD6-5]MDY7394357.1 M28 family peptidase [Aureibaculum sp. 2210JD6-5]